MTTATDPKREFAVEVVRRLKAAGYQALWAGGCVRDFLLGRRPGDYDVATDARPDEVRKVFGHRRTLAVGESFGVIVVVGPKPAGNVEVATFRSEGPYLDGRRPEHVAFTSPEEDAQRRDFTINGMFYDPLEQRVLDFVGGEHDLGQQIIRAIGNPHDRMREDKLRMLRAVRFAATLEFHLDEKTGDAIRELAAEILVVSAERIAQEFRRMLTDPHRRRAMQLTCDVGLLPVLFPELMPLWGESAVARSPASAVARSPDRATGPTEGLPAEAEETSGRESAESGDPRTTSDPRTTREWDRTLHMLQLLQETSFELAAATLWHPFGVRVVYDICRRLRFSNHETERICWLITHQLELDDPPHLSLAQLKRRLAHPWIGELLVLLRVQRLAANTDLTPVLFCEEYLRTTSAEEINPPPLITGNDLIALGLKPGKQFKEILEAARDAQLNGEIHTKEEALALAARLRDTHGGGKKGRSEEDRR